jgi:dolichyl-phosphate beta-glucosyltransferase
LACCAVRGRAIPAISLVTVIVPAYNEVKSIGATLREICAYFDTKPYGFEVIVAADGDDGTRELVTELAAANPRLSVFGQTDRRGKGYAIRHAVRIARGDVIGFVDADNKTPITEFDKFEAYLNKGYEVVIGSRALRGAQIERRQPRYRRMGSAAFGLVMHTMIGLRGIADTQCGFKFFRRGAASDVFARQRIDGYMFDVEVLYLLVQAGYRLAQVPVRWRDDGDSRLQLVRGNMKNIADILRIWMSRFYPAPVRTVPQVESAVNADGKPEDA